MTDDIIISDKKPKTSEEAKQGLGETFSVQAEEGWQGQEIHAKSTPLIDPGTGKAVIIRVFEFSKNPEFKADLSQQEIFNLHWGQIKTLLWSDGLEANKDIEPRVVHKDLKYQIFITCVPRLRHGIRETLLDIPQKLGEMLKNNKKTSR